MISPSAVGIERIGPDRMAQTATFRKFQYNGSAIKKQEGGSPDLTRVGRMRESKCVRQNVPSPINKDKSGRKHPFVFSYRTRHPGLCRHDDH
jgi:hypothetical protein